MIGGALYLTASASSRSRSARSPGTPPAGSRVFAGIFFVIPPLMNILPTNWNHAISEYLPSSAGADMFSLTHGAHDLAPGPGLALFCAYTAFAVAVAAVLLVRRDT